MLFYHMRSLLSSRLDICKPNPLAKNHASIIIFLDEKYGGIRSAPGTNLVIAIDLFVEPVDLCNLQDKLHKNIDKHNK